MFGEHIWFSLVGSELEVERVANIQEASNYCIYFDHLEPVASEVVFWLAELVATEAVYQSSIVLCGLVYSVSLYDNSLHVYNTS